MAHSIATAMMPGPGLSCVKFWWLLLTIIGKHNEAVTPLQGLLLPGVEMQAVVRLADVPTYHTLLETAPYISEQQSQGTIASE